MKIGIGILKARVKRLLNASRSMTVRDYRNEFASAKQDTLDEMNRRRLSANPIYFDIQNKVIQPQRYRGEGPSGALKDVSRLLAELPKGAWAALSHAQDKVISYGPELQEVLNKATESGEKNPVVVRVLDAHATALEKEREYCDPSLVYLLNRLDLIEELETSGSLGTPIRPKLKPFATPQDATWPMVSISLLSEHRAQITIDSVTDTRNYTEMGFEDSRSKNPDTLWEFLRGLAQHHGLITTPTQVSANHWRYVEKRVQRLRKRLQELFGIPDDPFEPFQQAKCYKTRFKIECGPSYKF